MFSRIQVLQFVMIFIVALTLMPTGTAMAQQNGFGGGGFGGGGQGGGGQGGQGGGIQAAGGITIDGEGVFSTAKAKVLSQEVARKRMQALAKDYLSEDVSRSSPLRKVSLVRLERAIAEVLEKKNSPNEEMQYLAGLQRIDFVFVFPETNDLVIAGPAGPFAPDPTGRVTGLNNGRAVLRLDDLMIAMRTAEKTSHWGCSIDVVPERLAEMQKFLKQNSGAGTANAAQQKFQQMQKILGNHDVTVTGVPNDTHFAQVLVEADYHMKLIAIGLEDPHVPGIKSHFALIQPGGNTLERWWFTPLYDAFQTSGDGLAFEFAGQRCQLLTQGEQADAAGRRSDAAFTRQSTQVFAKQFTEKFPELAKQMPVFSELQNLFDLAVLTALIKREGLAQKANWEPNLFLDDQRAPVLRGSVPKHTKTVLNMKMSNRGVAIALLSGGVVIDSQQILQKSAASMQISSEVSNRRVKESPPMSLEDKRWWWD